MSSSREFQAGAVTLHIVDNEAVMGEITASRVAAQIRGAAAANRRPVLWLMAAPSAFGFYRAFIELCRRDQALAATVRDIPIYQFDDYPVSRTDPRFPVTFRALLEEQLFEPLAEICGPLAGTRPMELTGTSEDADIAAAYGDELISVLDDPQTVVIQVKGIGMDGHWGFHGGDTPLDAAPAVIEVPIGSQNVRQQRIDWPQLFPRDEDVPSIAYTGTVALFMKADYIIDNVPQQSKQYSVLACYATDEISGAVPSSALKGHANAEAVLTEAAAGALLEYRERADGDGGGLPAGLLDRLKRLWDDPDNPEQATENCRVMIEVLTDLGLR